MSSPRLSWTMETDKNGEFLRLVGDIDEDSNFDRLTSTLEGQATVRINMREVARINSIGVREWVNFIRKLSNTTPVVLEQCSSVVVTQLNMISNFVGSAEVTSFIAPYLCDECGAEENVLLRIDAITAETLSGTRPCTDCDEAMELDDLPESYFAFATAAD